MRPPALTTPRPPYSGRLARRGDGMPGPPTGGHGHAIEPGVVDAIIREGNGFRFNDQGIMRDRVPWYDRDWMAGQDNTLVDWTRCGPIRPSLHMRQETVRRLVGTDGTRNLDPHPVDRFGMQDQGHGMHTNPAPNRVRTNQRFRSTTQQRPARINRLSPAAYSGQSYSQTTRIQGG